MPDILPDMPLRLPDRTAVAAVGDESVKVIISPNDALLIVHVLPLCVTVISSVSFQSNS